MMQHYIVLGNNHVRTVVVFEFVSLIPDPFNLGSDISWRRVEKTKKIKIKGKKERKRCRDKCVERMNRNGKVRGMETYAFKLVRKLRIKM